MNTTTRLICWGCALTMLAGCGGGAKLPVADPDALPVVQAQVQLGDEKIADAIVEFHSKDDKSQRIVSYYDSDVCSCYQFITTASNEKKGGVPEGEYSVTVKAPPRSKIKIPAKYAKPETSGLTAVVKAGDNLLPPFELTQ